MSTAVQGKDGNVSLTVGKGGQIHSSVLQQISEEFKNSYSKVLEEEHNESHEAKFVNSYLANMRNLA